MEIELNSINNGSKGTAVVGEETESSKGFTGLDELLEQELKEDDSVGCLRVGDGSGDGSDLALNYVVSNPPGTILYSGKEDADTDNILDKELADALSNNEDTSSDDPKLVHEKTTTVEVPIMSSVVVGDIITEEVIGITEEVINEGTDEAEDKTSLVNVDYQDESTEFSYNEGENGEDLENEYENAELAETQDACEEIAENEENRQLLETQEACEEIAENEENCELAESQEACEEIVPNVGDKLTRNQEEEIAENEYENEEYVENKELLENEDENKEYDHVDSVENEEICEPVQNESESVESVEEEYCDCPKNKDETDKILDVTECEINNEVDAQESVLDDTAMETEYGAEEQNSERGSLSPENPDECGIISDAAETEISNILEAKHGSEVQVQVSNEVKLPLEISQDDSTEIGTEIEENAMEEQRASVETSLQSSTNNVVYLMVQTKETNNKSNCEIDDNTSTRTTATTEAQCTENFTKTNSTRTHKQSAGNAVLPIGNNSEPKNITGINKPIIIKTIKTKLVKNSTSPATSKGSTTTTSLLVSNKYSTNDERLTVEKSEPKETKENHSEKPNKDIEKKSDKSKVIVSPTIKTNVWESRRSPRKQEKRVGNAKKVTVAKKGSQEKKNGIQKKRVEYTVMSKQPIDKTKVIAAAAGGRSDENEKKIQLVAVKRKLEEMFRVSQEEDEFMIDEIKKMKMETLDVLTKINAEIEKIKSVFLERQ